MMTGLLRTSQPAFQPHSIVRVAVVLNCRARGVTPRQVERICQLHPRNDVYVSSSLEESRVIARNLIERGYDRVLFGGGDGTFVRCLSDLEAEARHRGVPLPRVGVLRLGTGNALGMYLGVSAPTARGLHNDLRRAREQLGSLRRLPLLRVDGRLAPFAGTGLDSQILEDYSAATRMLDQLGVGSLLGSPWRYALAVTFRSLPRFLLRKLPIVEARNVGGPAYQIGLSGELDPTPLPPGTVLYRGPCTLASAGTIPSYGFNARILPFADTMPGKFHLRCTDASAFETLAHLPAVLRGNYRSPSLRDFLCDAVELRLEEPGPWQIGGDLLSDRRDHLLIEMADQPVHVIAP